MTRLPPVTLDKDFNPGKARWCDHHRRLECTKQRSKGRGDCHKWATRGTATCDLHSGLRRDVAAAKGDAMVTAWTTFGDLAHGVDYKVAVLSVLQMTWLRLNMISKLLQEQVTKQGGTPSEGGPEQVDGATDAGGLIGFRYGAAGKDGHIFAQGEEIRALVVLEAQERDRVVRYAEAAHKMGIQDRLIKLAEGWSDIVATKVGLVLDGLELSPEQIALSQELVTRHLSSVDLADIGGEIRETKQIGSR